MKRDENMKKGASDTTEGSAKQHLFADICSIVYPQWPSTMLSD